MIVMWFMELFIDCYLFNIELMSKFFVCFWFFDRKKYILGLLLMMFCFLGRFFFLLMLGDWYELIFICCFVVWLGEGGKKGWLWLLFLSCGKLFVLFMFVYILIVIFILVWER